MPLHAWLPRAHPIAPAHISALMSGVMVKVAIYGLIRVLVDWLGLLPRLARRARARARRALGASAASSTRSSSATSSACWPYSIENVGIIALGLGACLLLRARGADSGPRSRSRPRCSTRVNHALFKALLFLGAGAFERAVGSLELDRLGGLLRRMPWTGGAFLVGALAIAGLPPLNGFASEWLTLQALLHVPPTAASATAIAGALALAALAATAALAVLCFVKVVGLVLLGPPRREACADAVERRARCALALVALARRCVVLGIVPGLLFGAARRARALAGRRRPSGSGSTCPGPARCRRSGSPSSLVALDGVLVAAARQPRAAPAPTWACGQPSSRALLWTSAGFTQAAAPRARGRAPARARDRGASDGRRRAGGLLQRPRAAPDRRPALPAGRAARRSRPRGTRGGCRAGASGRTSRT